MRKLVAAATVLLLFCTAACRRPQPAHSRIDAALAVLIPSDTVAAAGLRLDKLKETQFYKTYIEGRQIRQIEQFAETTGIDPRKDLWEFLAVSNGKRPIVMVRGKFGGLFGQEPRFEGKGTERIKYKGYSILGSQDAAVTFLNTTVAVAGPVSVLQQIIDNRDNTREQPPQAIIDMVSELPASIQAWAVATQGGSLLPVLPSEGNFGNLARAFSSLGRFTATADLRTDLDMRIHAEYPDTQTAKQIHDAMRGLIGMGRLSTPDNQPEMLKLYDGISVKTEGTSVNAEVKAPFALLEQITRTFGMRKPA